MTLSATIVLRTNKVGVWQQGHRTGERQAGGGLPHAMTGSVVPQAVGEVLQRPPHVHNLLSLHHGLWVSGLA
jgi:hypothetical protein